MTPERAMAEQATGCVQRGALGQLYRDGGEPLDDAAARAAFAEGAVIHAPNAGAGSYGEMFRRLGADSCEIVDSTSSAGDWSFALEMGGPWRVAVQENRHPYHGFRYALLDGEYGTMEELLASAGGE